jgi:hypothetical protein
MTITKPKAGPAGRPLLAVARSAMPGLEAAEAALSRVQAAMLAAVKPRPHVDEAGALDGALTDLLAGRPLDLADLGTRLVQAEDAKRRTSAELTGLQQLRAMLADRRGTILVTEVDAGLAVLATELDTVVTAARPVAAKLGAVRDAQSAIDAGLAGEWSTLRGLAARHEEIRKAQAVLVADAAAARRPRPHPVRPGHPVGRPRPHRAARDPPQRGRLPYRRTVPSPGERRGSAGLRAGLRGGHRRHAHR